MPDEHEERIKALAKTAAINCVGVFSTKTIDVMAAEHWPPDAKFEEIIAATICDAQAEIERLRLGIQTVNVYLGNLPSAAALCLKTTLEAALEGAAFASLETLESECADAETRDESKAAIEQDLTAFRERIAEARGRHGRDFIRGLPQGKLLDALDANRESGYPTDV